MIGEGAYARAYARALLRAAAAGGEVERVTQDVAALELQWNGSPELRRFCRSHLPGSPLDHARLVERLWGDTFTRTLKFFLGVLTQWDHLRLLPLITRQYQAQADRARGCSNVQATFACEPAPEELDRVRRLVAAAYGPVMKLNVRVDPGLIAGVRLLINDKRVDASLAGRLARLRHGLSKPMRPGVAAC